MKTRISFETDEICARCGEVRAWWGVSEYQIEVGREALCQKCGCSEFKNVRMKCVKPLGFWAELRCGGPFVSREVIGEMEGVKDDV